MNKTFVSVICPVFNAAQNIEVTIKSVLSQSHSNIEFIIVDGDSKDGTLEVVSKYGSLIKHVISEPDNGMYDALVKGFEIASGEIICYINAGDFLNTYAVEVAVDIFNENSKTFWITGYNSICNENNVVTHVALPFRYKNSLIKVGSYGDRLTFIQQESTFWRKSLLKTVDFDFLKRLKYAGDYYLWWSFTKAARLEVVSCPFGVFKIHDGQLSENMECYLKEKQKFVNKRSFNDVIHEYTELLLWRMHPRIRGLFVTDSLYTYNHKIKKWIKTISG